MYNKKIHKIFYYQASGNISYKKICGDHFSIMHRIYTIAILCLLVLLDSAGSFKLKPSNSTTRQSHICTIDCDFVLSFNDPLVLPKECVQIETDFACEMVITIDYTNKEILFYSFENSESLTIDNITHDSATLHMALFEYVDNIIYHVFDYTCATGNDCEWTYIKEMIPKLIVLDYQPLFNSLSPILYNSNGQHEMIECYNNSELANCSSGACWLLQSADSIFRECSVFPDSFIEIGKSRYIPGPAKQDYDILNFVCNKETCNGPLNERAVKTLISTGGNEYISSLGIRSQLINSYFLGLILINISFYRMIN